MFEVFGWISITLLTICGLPEVYRTIRNKYCQVGWGFLIQWTLGVFTLGIAYYGDPKLMINSAVCTLCGLIMISYKFKDRSMS